jgi:hypothetical protein
MLKNVSDLLLRRSGKKKFLGETFIKKKKKTEEQKSSLR